MVTEFGEKISTEFVTEFGASPNSSLNSVQKSPLFPSLADIAHIPRQRQRQRQTKTRMSENEE